MARPKKPTPIAPKPAKSPNSFGRYLIGLRNAAGFTSQEAVIARAESLEGKHTLSKALLSLYERDAVTTPKIQTLRVLAKVYGKPYQELAQRWFLDRYQLDAITAEKKGNVLGETFEISNPDGGKGLTVCTIKTLQTIEENLPKGSQVGVSAVDFIFDETIFFDVVSKNLSRGIRHHYLIHESGRPSYQSFLTRVEDRYPKLKGKLDGALVRFVPRATLDFSVSYVLTLSPTGTPQAFIALPLGQAPFYYQVASPWLSWRLLDTFRWTLSLAHDPELRARLAALEASAEVRKMRGEASGFDAF